MEQLQNLYSGIHANPLLMASLAAVIIPFAVIAVGYLISLLGEALAVLVSFFMDPWIVYAVINYLFFPGVMLHELSHALFAVLTGAKVTEVALFKRSGESLGHVNFVNRGNMVIRALQNIFISAAPMFGGTAVILLCRYILMNVADLPVWGKVITIYIGVAMFFHMTMSKQDIKVYVKGIPLFMGILFVVVLTLRLTGIV